MFAAPPRHLLLMSERLITRKVCNGLQGRPQGDTKVGAQEMVPVFLEFPRWLGGMTEEEAGLALTMLAVA